MEYDYLIPESTRTINICLDLDKSFIPKAEYVFRTFCKIIGINPRFSYKKNLHNIIVYYGPDKKIDTPIKIYHDPNTPNFFQAIEDINRKKITLYKYKGEYVPFLFSKFGEILHPTGNNIIIRKDIIASAFFFLSCWQEYIAFKKKRYHKFLYTDTINYEFNFLDKPIVDIYAEIFKKSINIVMPGFIEKNIWPENKTFSLALTHDFDYWNYWDGLQKRQIKSEGLNKIVTQIKRNLRKIDNKFNANAAYKRNLQIINNEKKIDVSSTNFLLAKESDQDPRRNYIKNSKYRAQIKDILKNESIGLHGSEKSTFDLKILKNELEKIKKLDFSPIGFRSHYLNFEYQTLFKNLEKAGIKYDSSLGFNGDINYSFRAGVSSPFFPFNIDENRPFNVLEIPLVIMDVSIYISSKKHNNGLGYGQDKAFELMNKIKNLQSSVTVLWHNNTFDPLDYFRLDKLYWDLIKKAKKENAWIVNTDELYEHWINI